MFCFFLADDDCTEEEKEIAQECINLGTTASSTNAQTCEDNPNCNWVDNGCDYTKENGDDVTLYCMPRDLTCEVEEVVTDLDIRFKEDGTCGGTCQNHFWAYFLSNVFRFCAKSVFSVFEIYLDLHNNPENRQTRPQKKHSF